MSSPGTDDDMMDRTASTGPTDDSVTVESYETDEGVVFYDVDNPLAWVETSQVMSLSDLA